MGNLVSATIANDSNLLDSLYLMKYLHSISRISFWQLFRFVSNTIGLQQNINFSETDKFENIVEEWNERGKKECKHCIRCDARK